MNKNKIAAKWDRKLANRRARRSSTSAVADTGASGIYYSADAPVTDVDPTAPVVVVGTATEEPQLPTATAQHQIPNLPDAFPRTGHVMPGFQRTLIGIGPICDAGFTVTFSDESVIVQDNAKRTVLSGWRNPKEPPALWYFSLLASTEDTPLHPPHPPHTAAAPS